MDCSDEISLQHFQFNSSHNQCVVCQTAKRTPPSSLFIHDISCCFLYKASWKVLISATYYQTKSMWSAPMTQSTLLCLLSLAGYNKIGYDCVRFSDVNGYDLIVCSTNSAHITMWLQPLFFYFHDFVWAPLWRSGCLVSWLGEDYSWDWGGERSSQEGRRRCRAYCCPPAPCFFA